MTLDATFWSDFEASVGRLDAAVNALSFLPKKAGRKVLNTFEISLRVGPGLAPDHHFDVPNLDTLTTGLSGHAVLQRAAWRTAVVDSCEEVATHLRALHAALVATTGFANTKVLGVEVSPKKQTPYLWASDQGHAATTLRPGHEVLDGTVARLYGRALELERGEGQPVWLLSLNSNAWSRISEDHGFGGQRFVVHQRAASLQDAVFLASIKFPHLANLFRPGVMQAARLIAQDEVDLAVASTDPT